MICFARQYFRYVPLYNGFSPRLCSRKVDAANRTVTLAQDLVRCTSCSAVPLSKKKSPARIQFVLPGKGYDSALVEHIKRKPRGRGADALASGSAERSR